MFSRTPLQGSFDTVLTPKTPQTAAWQGNSEGVSKYGISVIQIWRLGANAACDSDLQPPPHYRAEHTPRSCHRNGAVRVSTGRMSNRPFENVQVPGEESGNGIPHHSRDDGSQSHQA